MSDALTKFDESKTAVKKELALVNQALALVDGLVVDNAQSFNNAGEWLASAKKRRAFIKAMRDEVVIPLGRIHKEASAQFKPTLDKYSECESKLQTKMSSYKLEQTQLLREREEQIRKQQEAELAAEKAEAEKEAELAEKAGDQERALEIREAVPTDVTPVVVLAAETPKIEGLKAGKKQWRAEVVDLDKVPMEFCKKTANLQLLNSMASQSEGRNAPAGVKYVEVFAFAMK